MSTPADRTLAAQAAAATRWGYCADRTAATQPAREGLRARFAREVDPDRTLSSAEREYRVDQLLRAHMLRMSIASKKARAQRKAQGKASRPPENASATLAPDENGTPA